MLHVLIIPHDGVALVVVVPAGSLWMLENTPPALPLPCPINAAMAHGRMGVAVGIVANSNPWKLAIGHPGIGGT